MQLGFKVNCIVLDGIIEISNISSDVVLEGLILLTYFDRRMLDGVTNTLSSVNNFRKHVTQNSIKYHAYSVIKKELIYK